MVTAEHAYNYDLREFCKMFGFDIKKHLLIKKEDKDVVSMHSMLSENAFYKKFIRKEGCFHIKNEKKIEKLRKKANKFIERTSGGSGYFNWDEIHEGEYQALKILTEEQAIKLFWYPKFTKLEELKETMPSQLRKYIPEFVTRLKFLAFVKFIYPKWIPLIEKCREVCLYHQKELNKNGKRYLPWCWEGEVNKRDHASIIHESIHNILRNSGADNSQIKHNAYREGIDVFFHRRSGLELSYFKAKHFWNSAHNYWESSQIFWEELQGIDDKNLASVLSKPENQITQRIIQRINAKWPDPTKFHSKD